ncbi:hypothetical protein [Brevundimonas vesicularis]|uniref:hypothetical protein n=1 Tax=Brevundimonas vesicularis TaxID=41276 RepID=UPI0038D3C1C7
MNAFELFFSLFGLILGLAIAKVIGGLSDVLRDRGRIRIGLLTPMLAVFVLIDLSSVWVNAWGGLSAIEVSYGPFVAASVVASIYFFAAAMVFPKEASDWQSLDDYYMAHYRWVIGGVILASLGLIMIEAHTNQTWRSLASAMAASTVTIIWWTCLIFLWLVRRKWAQYLGLIALQLIWIYMLLSSWAWG